MPTFPCLVFPAFLASLILPQLSSATRKATLPGTESKRRKTTAWASPRDHFSPSPRTESSAAASPVVGDGASDTTATPLASSPESGEELQPSVFLLPQVSTNDALPEAVIAEDLFPTEARLRGGEYLQSDDVGYFDRIPQELQRIFQAPNVESEDLRKSVDALIPMHERELEKLGGSYTLRSGDMCLVWRPTVGNCDFGTVMGPCYQRLAVYLQSKTKRKTCRHGQRFLLPRTARWSMYEASGAKGVWYDTISSIGWKDMHLVRHPVYLDYPNFVAQKATINKNICMQVSPFTEQFDRVNFAQMLSKFPEKSGKLSEDCASDQDPEYWTLRGCLRCMNVNNPHEVCEFNDYSSWMNGEEGYQKSSSANIEEEDSSPPGNGTPRAHFVASTSAEMSYKRWARDFYKDGSTTANQESFRQSVDPVLIYRQYEGKTQKIAFQMKWRECVARQLWASAYYKMFGRRLHFVYKMLNDELQGPGDDGTAVVRDLQNIDAWQGWEKTWIGPPNMGKSWKFRHVSFGFHGYQRGAGFMTATQGKNIQDIAIYGLAPLLENLAVRAPGQQQQQALFGAGPSNTNLAGGGDQHQGAAAGAAASSTTITPASGNDNRTAAELAQLDVARPANVEMQIKNLILFDSVCYGGKNKKTGKRISSSIGRVFESLYKRGWYRLQALGSIDLQSAYRFRFHSVRPGLPVFSFVQSDRSEGTRMLEDWQYLPGDTVDVVLAKGPRVGSLASDAVPAVRWHRAVVVDVGTLSPNTTLSLLYAKDQIDGPSPLRPRIKLCDVHPNVLANVPGAKAQAGMLEQELFSPQFVPDPRTKQRLLQQREFEDYAVLRPRLAPVNEPRVKRSPYNIGENVKVCPYSGRSCLLSDFRQGHVLSNSPLRVETPQYGVLEPWQYCGTDFVMKEAAFSARVRTTEAQQARTNRQRSGGARKMRTVGLPM
ncbi:unnamed protein product [Amoebophrya sp. A120]|nr:unnamed protein product [Amoebophrya sp. A120]|eukprot:GSA120T00003394001.1